MELQNDYRFKLWEWLSPFSKERKKVILKKIIAESGQSWFTIRRIMYMKSEDTGYVRTETKTIICRTFRKDLTEFENPTINK